MFQKDTEMNDKSVYLFLYSLFISLLNIIQQNITINFTITGWQKKEAKNRNKQAKKAKYESSTDLKQLAEQIEKQ